jgi:hypothetical protein
MRARHCFILFYHDSFIMCLSLGLSFVYHLKLISWQLVTLCGVYTLRGFEESVYLLTEHWLSQKVTEGNAKRDVKGQLGVYGWKAVVLSPILLGLELKPRPFLSKETLFSAHVHRCESRWFGIQLYSISVNQCQSVLFENKLAWTICNQLPNKLIPPARDLQVSGLVLVVV